MKKNDYFLHFIIISSAELGQRVDNFLLKNFKSVPKSRIYCLIRKGAVLVNKKIIKPKYKLQIGDELRIPHIRNYNNKNSIFYYNNINKVSTLIDAIIYEDDYLLAINKPAGTVVHGCSGINFGIIESMRFLRPDLHFLELVHRLDRDTSGVLLLAKKRSSLHSLHKQLRIKGVKKNYIALVRGKWKSNIKIVTVPLLKNNSAKGENIVHINNAGKQSETRFKVAEIFTFATLVNINPITGRTHQIRVHSNYAGHPIAFDDRYGDIKFNKKIKECGLNRLFLHAKSISFKHPYNGKILIIEAPIDDILNKCLMNLRNYYKDQ